MISENKPICFVGWYNNIVEICKAEYVVRKQIPSGLGHRTDTCTFPLMGKQEKLKIT